MRKRAEVARYVEAQFSGYECPFEKPKCWHYGRQDARALLDFIYCGPPKNDDEAIKRTSPWDNVGK